MTALDLLETTTTASIPFLPARDFNNPYAGQPFQCQCVGSTVTPEPVHPDGSQTPGTACNIIPAP